MRWKIHKKKSDDLIQQILINRGIEPKDQDKFLNPKLTELNDPFDLPDMEKAVSLLKKAKKKSWSVGIFADYDADGIPGGVLMKEICDQLEIESEVYIPSRKEGYGLNTKAINQFVKKKHKILITVDLGIVNQAEIKYAQDKGMKVIVLDHHEPMGDLPTAEAVVDAKREDSQYLDREISGAAVVFKLGQALADKKLIDTNFLKWSLDLIGISVISDVVPLLNENRILAHYGLIVLRQTKRPGLNALYREARIDPKAINPYTVGFQIGPRINAPGRMDQANQAYYLLATDNDNKAKSLAEHLNQINQKRKDKLEQIFEKAKEKIQKDKLDQKKAIVVSGKNWPKGVIGLVASRVTQEYGRPTVILSEGKQYSEGSARTIPAFDILKALESSGKFLTRFGGHKMAAGLKLENKQIKNFYDNLVEQAENELTEKDLEPIISIDAEIELNQVNDELYQRLSKLEPHGMKNPRPIFISRQAEFISKRLVGDRKQHLKLKLKNNGQVINAIGFDLGKKGEKLRFGNKIDLCYSVDENIFNGNRSIQLNLKDCKINN